MAVVVSGSFSPSPSARACSDLKADVASYVNAPNSARALAKAEDFLGVAVAKLNTVIWPWAIVNQDITLVVDQIDYDLAYQFLAPRHAYRLDSNDNVNGSLHFMDMKTFSVEFADTTGSGTPSHYTAYNPHYYGTISLNVAPTTEFVTSYPAIRLFYYQKVVPCGGSTTALDVPHEVAEWCAWYAKGMMAAHFDPGKVVVAQSYANDLWRQLIAQKANVQLSDWD